MAVQGDCQGPLKTGGNSHLSRDPTVHCKLPRKANVSPVLHLDWPITEQATQANNIGGHISS